MSLDRYRLRAQLGAGPDGVAYRAIAEDGATEVEVIDLDAARRDAGRWKVLAPRLRVAAQLVHPSAIRMLELELEHDRPYAVLEWVGATTLAASVAANGPKTRRASDRAHPCSGRCLEGGSSAGIAPRPARS